MISPWCEL